MNTARLRTVAAVAAASALLVATEAMAQSGLFEQAEKQGTAFGRATAAWGGPVMLMICVIAVAVGAWALKASARPENRGRGHLAVALTAFIAAFIAGGYGAFVTLGSSTVTGGAATASTAPFTLNGR